MMDDLLEGLVDIRREIFVLHDDDKARRQRAILSLAIEELKTMASLRHDLAAYRVSNRKLIESIHVLMKGAADA